MCDLPTVVRGQPERAGRREFAMVGPAPTRHGVPFGRAYSVVCHTAMVTVALVAEVRRYGYVGPAELYEQVYGPDSVELDSPASWLARQDPRELAEPVTFVVAVDGVLRLGPRRSEHVALARGQEVLAAGEIRFVADGDGWRVAEVTNQSTGYCPDPNSWPAVAAALEREGVPDPGDFTSKIIFRRCPGCDERNIVRDDDFTCALCGSALPPQWNFA